ncbi:MAG: type III polyketide synthase [Bacteroidia bacterium]
MSKIISIGTAVPQHRTPQPAILEFMHAAYDNEVASRKLNVLFNNSGISSRYSVVPDFDKNRRQHVFFNGTPSKATVQDRLDVFKERAVPLAISAIDDSFNKLGSTVLEFGVTHLITVSCTGLYAPGLDAELMGRLKLPNDIFHTSVNFLGCNAAFHALKIADMITKSDSAAKVLVVCVELCTIHFQPKDDHDNLLSNTIFGDGAAAVIITADDNRQKGVSVKGFYSVLLDKGKDLMGWNITPRNFEMILDAGIPALIGDEVNSLVVKASSKMNISPGEIQAWAIHPGGKKILDVISDKLHLKETDIASSYKVLNEYGNMSSPTVLFVLNDLLERNVKGNIFSIGFGPGLSIETALFFNE